MCLSVESAESAATMVEFYGKNLGDFFRYFRAEALGRKQCVRVVCSDVEKP